MTWFRLSDQEQPDVRPDSDCPTRGTLMYGMAPVESHDVPPAPVPAVQSIF